LRFVLRNTFNTRYPRQCFGPGYIDVHFDNFIHGGTQTEMNEFIQSTFEVLGEVTGNVETFVNGKADSKQPEVVKAKEALAQLRDKIQAISTESHIFPMLDESYEADLNELKANPAFTTITRRKERWRERSEMSSTAPSRSNSPELKRKKVCYLS